MRIKANNFRSIKSLDCEIGAGINVLVGSNGSGKTNIVSLLEFISNFINSGLHTAISKSGGALRVFPTELISDSLHSKCKLFCEISGTISADDIRSFDFKNNNILPCTIEYKYYVSISIDKETFKVSVEEEYISWKKTSDTQSTIVGTVSSSKSGKKNIFSPGGKIDPIKIMNEDFYNQISSITDFDQSNIKDMKKSTLENNSFFKLPGIMMYPDIRQIRDALKFDRSFNISPLKVRMPEDIASRKSISDDGSGVISKLYDLKNRSEKGKNRKRDKSTSTYEKICQNFSQVNDNVIGIDVLANVATGKYECFVNMGDRNKPLRLPLTAVSDGTAKWLAILTIARTRGTGGYCIEEPENYLHPSAQRMFLQILRDTCKSKNNKFYIVTTHSETIVNCTDVREIIITEIENNGTVTRKVSNPEEVQNALNETGFGLGFLYSNERL